MTGTPPERPPLESLEFLYVGTTDFDRDRAHYTRALRAPMIWAFKAFGAKVGAFRVSEQGPLLLLADHRPAGTCLPVYRVGHLEPTVADLRSRGWSPAAGPIDIPNGPCYIFKDPSGNELAIFQDDRPRQMERAYADPASEKALR